MTFKPSLKKFQTGSKDTRSDIPLDHIKAAQIQKNERARDECVPTKHCPVLGDGMQQAPEGDLGAVR